MKPIKEMTDEEIKEEMEGTGANEFMDVCMEGDLFGALAEGLHHEIDKILKEIYETHGEEKIKEIQENFNKRVNEFLDEQV